MKTLGRISALVFSVVAWFCTCALGDTYQIRAVAVLGQPTPVGGTFQSYMKDCVGISDTNEVIFASGIQGLSSDHGLFSYKGGTLTARSIGDDVYDLSSVNAFGAAAFKQNKNIYVNDSSGDHLRLLDEGQQGIYSYQRPSISDSGVVLVQATRVLRGEDILVIHDGVSRKLLTPGMGAPGGIYSYASFESSQYGRNGSGQAINANGDYVLFARLDLSSNYGIFMEGPNRQTVSHDTSRLWGPPVLNNVGDVACYSWPYTGYVSLTIVSSGQTRSCLHRSESLAITLGVHPSDGYYAELGGEAVSMNDAGVVAFKFGSSADTYDPKYSGIGLLSGDEIIRIAVNGDPVPGIPGLTFTSFGQPDINSAGYVAFSARLSDGSYGVFLAVPEPATLALLALGGLAMLRRK